MYVYLDHVLPESRGGGADPINILPSCERCNCSKGARTPSEWRKDLPSWVYTREQQSLAAHPGFKRLRLVPVTAEPQVCVSVVLGQSERERLRARAASEGVPMAPLVRRLILDELDRAQTEVTDSGASSGPTQSSASNDGVRHR
jgi:hypothetical protein